MSNQDLTSKTTILVNICHTQRVHHIFRTPSRTQQSQRQHPHVPNHPLFIPQHIVITRALLVSSPPSINIISLTSFSSHPPSLPQSPTHLIKTPPEYPTPPPARLLTPRLTHLPRQSVEPKRNPLKEPGNVKPTYCYVILPFTSKTGFPAKKRCTRNIKLPINRNKRRRFIQKSTRQIGGSSWLSGRVSHVPAPIFFKNFYENIQNGKIDEDLELLV